MGATTFINLVKAESAKAAFHNAVEEALYDYGHAGYTGTIAEKDSYVIIPNNSGKSAIDYAEELINNCDERIDDKWGPAGCIDLGGGEYLFFGWASC